jgi:hypothetical protein
MPFEPYYMNLVNKFNDLGGYHELHPVHGPIDWPHNRRGVYAVWKKLGSEKKELIYVGKVGSYKNDNQMIVYGGGYFHSRANRWTPYRFCEDNQNDNQYLYNFRYRPTYPPKQQGASRFNNDAYLFSIPYTEILIQCFIIDANHETYSPILLESEILTNYLKYFNTLPPANIEL